MAVERTFFRPPAGHFFLFGPRGAGKSTWVQTAFPKAVRVDLPVPARQRQYAARPERLREPAVADVVIDGVQRVPEHPRVNHRRLFDLADDPDELRNLAADPAHGPTPARLEALLEGWRAVMGDAAPLETAGPSPLRRDLTGRERVPDRWQPPWIVDKYFGPAPRRR